MDGATLDAPGSYGASDGSPSETRALQRSTLELGLVLQESYLVRDLLGRGGMGAVYAALDLNLKRSVAIKVPSTREAAEMMRQEAQALAAFSHRGLPAVYALGSYQDWPFIVMERIHGRTLEAAIEEAASAGGLPIERALHWALQLIEVVQVLHAANLAHRDLKPENVMLAPGDRLVLLDLGIVRQERFIGNEQTITGSPHYIAPETVRAQVRQGEAHLVDIYALGVTLYEMLTGQLPYDAESPMELMHMHVSHPVPRISAKRAVPSMLDDVVFEMMSKTPVERPSSIEQVAQVFRHLRSSLSGPRPNSKQPPNPTGSRPSSKQPPNLPDPRPNSKQPPKQDGSLRLTRKGKGPLGM